jgi:hypothetical protein
MLQKAIEDELQQFLSEQAERLDEQGRRLVVGNGHLPPRSERQAARLRLGGRNSRQGSPGNAGEVLLAFYDFPAQAWIHLRTTNPIESTFATIRLRHRRTKRSGTRRASLAMMFKRAQSAEKRWRRPKGHEQITYVLQGDKFIDGIRQAAA